MDVNVMKSHTLLALLLCLVCAVLAHNATVNVNVGLVLDLGSPNGKMWQSCINLALSDFYASHAHYRTRLILHTRDSKNDTVGAAAAALELIETEQVEAIIGPQTSMQAKFVINLGKKAQVPIITFSATSPSLRSIRSDYFIRATQNDSSQVKAISSLLKHFRWREAVVIYEDTEYGEGIIPYLNDALQQVDARVTNRTALQPNMPDDEIEKELRKLKTMPTRVFIVHLLPNLASRLFTKAKQIEMMEAGYVWIVTNGIVDQLSSVDPTVVKNSMQGVLGIKTHVPQREALKDFKGKWKRQFNAEVEVDVFGLWAHDAAVALARAVDKSSLAFQEKNHSSSKEDHVVMGLEAIGVSQNGPKLLQELKRSHFRGLSGDFCLVNGELQSSTFQIVNIKGPSFEGIGYWKPFNTVKVNAGDILWPGRSTYKPKGWDGKTLIIGVPKVDGFAEFVNVTGNDSMSANVTGYCIDVFKAVIEELPYKLAYKFSPFVKPNGERAGNYNDLVYQVFLGAYDAVVGDVTIVGNRSEYVDFTLPFTESGVSMIVPIKGEKKRNPWAFFKPLTWDMWATSVCFFLFIGFIIWVLEHRNNPDFRGPPSYQVGTSIWFSFSTMLFAHRETVVSNLSRFVMIIWCFVVLILTQSYTASLASLLTVENLQPAVTDVYQLLKNGDYVGYQQNSFVLGLLKEMGFHESKIRSYTTSQECHELFTKGSANKGIAAAFDEAPYMNSFLAEHSSKYTMIKPKFKTGGFGFVFPKGSPLVADVSRAILNVTQGDKIAEIKKAWLKSTKSSYPDGTGTSTLRSSSSSLGLDSFWGLFVIAGCVASLAVIIFTAMFLYEHGYATLRFNSESSIWTRIGLLWRSFDEKDLRSHAFSKRREEVRNKQGICVDEEPNFAASPLSRAESHIVFFGDQASASDVLGDPIDNAQTSTETDDDGPSELA